MSKRVGSDSIILHARYFISVFKYNLTFIVLFFGITLVHAGDEGDEKQNTSKEGIELYYTDWSAPCRSVLMIGQMLDIPFKLIHIDLEKHEHYDDKFENMNPQRTIPTINDKGFVLWESRAIIVYLVEEYGTGEQRNLFPNDTKKKANINKMLQFDMGNLGQAFINLYSPWMFFKTPKTEFKQSKLTAALQLFEKLLGDKYAAGDSLTVADVALVANILNIEAVGEDLTAYTKINEWLKKCKENMKGFNEANEKGIQKVKEKAKIRKEEESIDLVDGSVSNRDVFTALSTLLSGVRSQVLAPKHIGYFKSLMDNVTPLVKRDLRNIIIN